MQICISRGRILLSCVAARTLYWKRLQTQWVLPRQPSAQSQHCAGLWKTFLEKIRRRTLPAICWRNQLVKIVSSFQKYVEEQFRRLENAINFRIRPRLFQSIQESDDIWRKATTVGYRDILSTDEYERLVVYFQQRHILEHEDGFIDQLYIDRSGDQRLVVGQRLVVSEENVLELVEIVEELSQGLPIHKN